MADQPCATQLRERAAGAREHERKRLEAARAEGRLEIPACLLVGVSPDEAEALADALEAAADATLCESSHPRDRGRCGNCPPCLLRAALDRLARLPRSG